MLFKRRNDSTMSAPHKSNPAHAGGAFLLPCIRHGAGLLFYPAAIQPHTSVYSAFCVVHANYTANAAKQRTELCSGFSCDYARSAARDTRPTQAAIYHLRHAGAYHSTVTPSAYTRYNRHAGRCTSQRSRPIIIKYIRGCSGAPLL